MSAVRGWFGRFEYKYLVAAAFVFGLFMDIVDTTIVNVALPKLADDFHATTAQLEWVVTGYLLSLAIWIPASGWIGDRFGTKRTFLFATAMFIVGSALCGRAWSIESLAIFRVIQGIGGGMMTPVGMAMLYRVFTVQERAQASAIMGVPTQIAPMIGPLLGGYLVDSVSWRGIFYVNVPIGILSFLFSWIVLREHREEHAGKFDPWGFLLSGIGLAGILFALSEGPQHGWASFEVLATGFGGLASFGGLIWVETHVPDPMLDLSLFRDRMFRLGNLTAFTIFAAQLGLLFVLPLYLQEMRGFSALDSGLVLVAQPLTAIFAVQVTSRLLRRLGPSKTLLGSCSGIVATAVLLMLVGASTDLWWIRGIMAVRGIAVAFNMVGLQTTAFSNVRRAQTGRASSLFSTQRQVSAAFGVAVLATVLVTRTKALTAGLVPGSLAAELGSINAFHDACAAAAALGVLGIIFSLRIRDRDVLLNPEQPRQPALAAQPEPVPAS